MLAFSKEEMLTMGLWDCCTDSSNQENKGGRAMTWLVCSCLQYSQGLVTWIWRDGLQYSAICSILRINSVL